MKMRKVLAGLVPVAALLGMLVPLGAQQAALKRTVLQRGDLSTPGREAVTALVEIPPGVAAGRHTHPGEEVGYVLEGTLILEVEGKPAATLKAGDVFLIPAGTIHDAKGGGAATTKLVSTYIVEKGKPLATPVP